MDPLSLTANIIAVVSAASEVSKKVQKLCSLRNAPQEFLQFFNELSDIQVVLTFVNETSTSFKDENTGNIQIKNYLEELLCRTTKVLDEFDNIMQSRIGNQSTNTTLVKFSWRGWMQNASRLRELSGALKALRLDMNQTLTVMTASELPRMRTRLAEVTAQNSHTETILNHFEEHTAQQIESVISSMRSMQTSIAAALTPGNAVPPNNSTNIRVQTSVFSGRSCKKGCFCRCHMFTKYKSPDWLDSLVGKLLIGYSSIPSRVSCNERLCKANNSWLLTVSYYFPRWFLGRCMISFSDRWSLTEGHVISVRTPRVLSSETELVFTTVQCGNLGALQTLFEQRLASPFDTRPKSFQSLLSIAVAHHRTEICAFLLSQYADANIENVRGISAVDMVWDDVLAQPDHSVVRVIKDIFDKHADPDEQIHKRGFTILHRIVLNLSPINLRAQLQTSTTEIDTPCSLGRTPLHWAAIQSNIEVMKLLIEFGATVHLQDKRGDTPLHHTGRHGTTEALQLLLATIASNGVHISEPEITTSATSDKGAITSECTENFLKLCLEQRDQNGFTALFACTYGNADRTEIARILLDAGADVDSAWSSWSFPIGPPLIAAIQKNQHPIARLLLERGARLDLYDGDIQGTLHYVAIFGDLEMIQIIAHEERLKDLDADHKDAFGDSPLQAFDKVRPHLMGELEAVHQECRRAFLHLLSRTKNGVESNTSTWPQIEEVVSEDSEDGEDVFYDIEEESTGSA